MRNVSEALRTAVTTGLPESAVVGHDGVTELVEADVQLAVANRVQGLVWRALESGAVIADEEVTNAAHEAQLAALRTSLVAEEACVLALDALDRADVETWVLKGVAICHLDHRDPAERIFGDADVLIRPADLDSALQALGQAGLERSEPPIWPWWERRFGKSVVLHGPNGGELDLHLRIAAGYFGEVIDHERLREGSEQFELAGRTVQALGAQGRFLHACVHSVLGGGSGLRALRDVAQLVLRTNADWSAVVTRADVAGFDGVLSTAIESTWMTLGLDAGHPAAAWASTHHFDEEQTAAIEASARATPGWSSEGLGALPAYGWFDRARFVAGLVVPSRASLRTRNRTRRQHVRRLARSWRSAP